MINKVSDTCATMQEPSWHLHPVYPHRLVFGSPIEAGTRLETTDVYDSTSGRWERCPCPGIILEVASDHVRWIRPCPVPAEPAPHNAT